MVGHDSASPQISETSVMENGGQYSVFFCGIGDARNLFATLLTIGQAEAKLKVPCKKTYHFTLNDINHNVLARDIVLICLLQRYSDLPDEIRSGEEGQAVLSTLFFVYAAAVMPQYAFEILQKTISQIIEAIATGTDLPAGVTILDKDRSTYLGSLRSWQGELNLLFTTKEILDLTRRNQLSQFIIDSRINPMGLALAPIDPEVIEEEKAFYRKAGLSYPPKTTTGRFEPDLQKLFLQLKDSKSSSVIGAIFTHICKNWKVNTTFLDLEWHKRKGLRLDLGFSPFELHDKLYEETVLERPDSSAQLADYVLHFFAATAKAIDALKGRLRVEILLGEGSAVAEQVRHGTLESRSTDFPHVFDVVHLSNVPGKLSI